MNKIDAGEDEAAWLAQRWELVGGSSAAVLMGMSPFKTRDELLLGYVNRKSDFTPGHKTWCGLQFESAIGRALGVSLGCSFSPKNELRWKDGSCIGATTDGYLSVSDMLMLPDPVCPSGHKRNWVKFAEEASDYLEQRNLWVEIKNVGQDKLSRAPWNRPGSPPEYYWAQCQTQLLVLDEPKMALVALVGGQDLRGHIIERDEIFLDELQDAAKEFMEEVREGREL